MIIRYLQTKMIVRLQCIQLLAYIIDVAVVKETDSQLSLDQVTASFRFW